MKLILLKLKTEVRNTFDHLFCTCANMKRIYQKETETHDNEEPLKKRQKVKQQVASSTIFETITSKQLSNYDYNSDKQFRQTFATLKSFQFRNVYGFDISYDVLNIIARYTVGKIVTCATDACGKEMLVLDNHNDDDNYCKCDCCDDYYCRFCVTTYRWKRIYRINYPIVGMFIRCSHCNKSNVCPKCSFRQNCAFVSCGKSWISCLDCTTISDFTKCSNTNCNRIYCNKGCKDYIHQCEKCQFTYCNFYSGRRYISCDTVGGCKKNWACKNIRLCNQGICHNCDVNKCCSCDEFVERCDSCAGRGSLQKCNDPGECSQNKYCDECCLALIFTKCE